jgi:hypothetical protein
MQYGFHEDAWTSGLRAAAEHLPDVHPPFEIVKDHDHLIPAAPLLGFLFDMVESTGLRAFVGAFFTLWLAIVRMFLGVLIDLKHIQGTSVKRPKTA